jgi:UMF1 family MFS transporter
MPFLVWSTVLCVAATALIARGPFVVSAILFVIANAAYQAGVQFYDALLPAVTTPENRGRISGIGVGVGYVGSYIAVAIGFLIPSSNRPLLFAVLAAAFLLVALPCFVFVRETPNPRPRAVWSLGAAMESTKETWRTLRSTQAFPGLARFLVGRVFYTDAINTVIAYMGLYTLNVAMAGGLTRDAGEGQARLVLLFAISFAIVGGILWGRLVDRIGAKRTLDLVLLLWIVQFSLAAAVGAWRLPIASLYVVAALAGIALGGIWAADRPLMLRLSPPDRIGEFYGLYGMVGRFSAIVGPLLWSAITYAAVERSGLPALTGQALAITSLLAMVVIAFLILRPIEKRSIP